MNLRGAREAVLCVCVLLPLVAWTAHAGPRWEFEAGVQAARMVLDESAPPVGLSLSGFAAVGAALWQGQHMRVIAKLGYDDATYRNRTGGTVPEFGGPFPDREWQRLQSLWIPAHLLIENREHLQFEFGPEWRYLLRASGGTYRADGAIPAVSGASMAGLDRTSFAFSAGLGLEWRALGGYPGVDLRWVEGLESVLEHNGGTYLRPHAGQLALHWRR
jgi:hypothetical protein